MMQTLRVVNMVMTGRLPFKRLNIISIAEKLGPIAEIINDEICPVLQIRLDYACVSVWNSGAINIVGLKSESDGYRAYDFAKKKISGVL